MKINFKASLASISGCVFAGLLSAPDASAATLYLQQNNIRGPDVPLDCSGAKHGRCKIKETGALGTSSTSADDIDVDCTLTSAVPSSTYEFFWTCTTVARGCHGSACGFISLGTATTNASGTAVFSATLDDNPFPGSFVHVDILGPDVYTAVYGAVPVGVVGLTGASAAAGSGDPTD